MFFLYLCVKLVISQFYLKILGGAIDYGKSAICDKTASHGNKLSITRSHISKRSPRTWKPNLRSVKAEINGEVK